MTEACTVLAPCIVALADGDRVALVAPMIVSVLLLVALLVRGIP